MGHAPVAIGADRQGFAAPEAAIVSLAGAIPGHTQRRALDPMFRHHGQQVGVVVLHGAQRQLMACGQLLGPCAGAVARVLIAGQVAQA